MLLQQEADGAQFGFLHSIGEGIGGEGGEAGDGASAEIGDGEEEEDGEDGEDRDNVPLLELQSPASRAEIFDVECGGGGSGRSGRLPDVLFDEVVAVVFVVGRRIHLHWFVSHGGGVRRRPSQ